MMGLAKMAPDGWEYYASEIAAGAEDYYIGPGEEPGRWVGRGSTALGLSGEADREGLARLFGEACHPVTGAVLGRGFAAGSGAIAGYPLSFSPPKSVSILWGLCPGEIADAVRAGHDAAVSAALDFLQDHAAFCRRGHAGTIQEPTRGYVAAAFVHRTSRALDPQLHTHVLVANRVQAVSDGRWLSLDGRELYEVQKAAGVLYKAALRAEMSSHLGVSWTDVDIRGGAEIVGVPEGLIRRFSKRRVEVKAAAAGLIRDRQNALGRSLTGDERAAILQVAAYQSRAAKDPDNAATTEGLRAAWQSEADTAGAPVAGWVRDVFGPSRMTGRDAALGRLGMKPSVELMVAEVIDRLERTQSTWGRADVIEAVSTIFPAENAVGADEARRLIETAAELVLSDTGVVRLGSHGRPGERHSGARYSTWWTLQTEQAVLEVVEAGRRVEAAVADEAVVDQAVTGLGDDQAEAVRRICGGGERVAVLVGPAGSGKTRTLAAARTAWENAGIAVCGIAPSAVAAGVLAESAGIPSETLAKWLKNLTEGRTAISPGSVIVCDEASMVSTRDLAQLVLFADHAGAIVVLVGDHHQLGSVEAGGMFRLLAADAKTAELTHIRRFNHPWEADATGRLRHGDRSVIDTYRQHGRIASGDRERTLDAAHRAWLDARSDGRSVVVTAADRDTVDQLAMKARAALIDAGQVEAGGIVVGGQVVGVGDEIVTTRNHRALVTSGGGWVRNGDRWQITGRDDQGSLAARSLDGRGRVTLPADYVAEHLALAYAVTIHKAQGITVDHSITLIDSRTSREHLYVGATRGRNHNQLAVISEPAGDDHQPPEPCSATEVLEAVIARSSSQKSATETIRDDLELNQPITPGQKAIIRGLRDGDAHSYQQAIRREQHNQTRTRPQTSHPTAETSINRTPSL